MGVLPPSPQIKGVTFLSDIDFLMSSLSFWVIAYSETVDIVSLFATIQAYYLTVHLYIDIKFNKFKMSYYLPIYMVHIEIIEIS